MERIEVIISPKCVNTINDFVLTKEAPDGTKNKEMDTDSLTKVRFQKVGHFSDLFDYFMCSAFASDFSTYQRGGIVRAPVYGKNPSKHGY
jgi:hypothetical protein